MEAFPNSPAAGAFGATTQPSAYDLMIGNRGAFNGPLGDMRAVEALLQANQAPAVPAAFQWPKLPR